MQRNIELAVALAAVLLVAAGAAGCVEDSDLEEPNSDEGHLFVDLEEALAVDWQSEVLVRGPSTGGEFCDDELGCYPEHETLEMKAVESSDPDVVEVEGFEPDTYGQAEAVRLDLEVVGEGEATLEFRFEVPGADIADQTGEGDHQEGSEVLTDSFDVTAREVAAIRLSRMLEHSDPQGPFGQCPERGPGTYLMATLDDYTIPLQLAKLDDQGELLRGSGEFPVDVQPEGAVEVEEFDESNHLVTIRPRQFGQVELIPDGGGSSLEATFASLGDVTEMDVALHQVNEHGQRIGETDTMYAEYPYELEALPRTGADAPLCDGQVQVHVDSLTPAICDVYGELQTTGNPLVVAEHGGECRLRVTMEGAAGGGGLVEDRAFGVEYNW